MQFHAQFNLPSSILFQFAFHGKDQLEYTGFEEEKLIKWRKLPPYSGEAYDGKDTNWLEANIQKLSDALHGWELREQRDYEDFRLKRYKAMLVQDFAHEVHNNLL